MTVAAAGTIAVVAIAYAGGVDPTVASGINFGPTVSATSAASVAAGTDKRPLVTAPAVPTSHGSGMVSLATTGIPGFTRIPSAQLGSPAPDQGPGPPDGSGRQTAPSTAGDSRAPAGGAASTPSLSVPPDVHTTLSVPRTATPATTPSLTTSAGSSTPPASALAVGSTGASSSAGALDERAGGTGTGASSGITPNRGSGSTGSTGSTGGTSGGGAGSGVSTGGFGVGGTGGLSAGSGGTSRWSGTGHPAASNRGSRTDRPPSEGHGSVSPSFVPPDYPVVVADATNIRHGQSGSRHPTSR